MRAMARWSTNTLLVLLVVGGCIFNPDKDEGEAQDPLSTPEGTLEQLETAYLRLDIDLYLEALSDTFVFHFLPRDVGDIWPNPTWGRTEEEQYHRRMFEQAHSIELIMAGDYANKVNEDPETWSLYREYDLIVWLSETEMSEASPAYGWAEFIIAKGEDDRFRIVDWYDLEQQP